MNKVFWTALSITLLPLAFIWVVGYRANRLGKLQVILICVFLAVLMCNGFLYMYILYLLPEFSDKLGAFFTTFYQQGYFLLYHAAVIGAVLFVYKLKRTVKD
jgi:hypothetical protein